MLTRRRFLEGLIATGSLGVVCSRSDRPSFLVLVSDDQRADTLGCAGNPVVRTPHVDALAAAGTLFENAFVTTSVCPSSRASILTGQYTRRHGVWDFRTPLTRAALAESYPGRLRVAGYRTGFVGKWGLAPPLPREAFDVFAGFAGQGRYWQGEGADRRYLTDLLVGEAGAFLESTPSGQPFCLSVSFKAPHGPWLWPHPRLAELYRDATPALAPTASLEAAATLPGFLRDSLAGNRASEWLGDREALRERIRGYYRLISGVDQAVGALVEALDRVGRADDTVIVYTSDNGFMLGEHGLVGKWVMYEPSIRVPLVVRDPSLPKTLRGRRVDAMVLNLDVAPTLLELAGLSVTPSMQGRSLAPLLRGTPVTWREDWFYEHDLHPGEGYLPSIEGVRTRDWKYVTYLDERSDREALFDLRGDPDERSDLSGRPEHAATLERLRARWREQRAAAG